MTNPLSRPRLALAMMALAALPGLPAGAEPLPECSLFISSAGDQIVCFKNGLVSSCAFGSTSSAPTTLVGTSVYSGIGEYHGVTAATTSIRCLLFDAAGLQVGDLSRTENGNVAALEWNGNLASTAELVCIQAGATFGPSIPPIEIGEACAWGP
jgi:hypothetical protein